MKTEEKMSPEILHEWQGVKEALESNKVLKKLAEEARDTLQTNHVKIRRAVEVYNAARLELFKKRLEEMDERWCSVYWGGEGHIVKEPVQSMLIRVKGDREDDVGSHSFSFDDYVLVQACPSCVDDRGRMWGKMTDSTNVVWIGNGIVPDRVLRPELQEDAINRLIDTRPEDDPGRYRLPPRAEYGIEGILSRPYLKISGEKIEL